MADYDNLFPPFAIDDDSFTGDIPQRVDNLIYPSASGTFMPKTEYTYEERRFRNQFVNEYVKDNNAVKALMRLGRSRDNAVLLERRIMSEALVQELIANHRESIVGSSLAEREDILKQDVVMVLRGILADESAKASERVAAARLLSDLHGFAKQQTADTGDTSGVMLVPIHTGSLDDWSALAQSSQAQLKVDVLRGIDD